jgi:hypothetical protein
MFMCVVLCCAVLYCSFTAASDNEDVKDNFTAILEADHSLHHNFTLRIMRVETNFIQHVKSLDKMKSATNNEGNLICGFEMHGLV